MANKTIKSKDLPEGENVYLKKGFTGEWRVVHPWKREDGSLNWFAIFFGSKGNLFVLLVMAIVIVALYFGILDLIGAYQEVAADPCSFCSEVTRTIDFAPEVDSQRLIPQFNISDFDI